MTKGRLHLPVSPTCNIGCRFCKRRFNKSEQRPGVTARLLNPCDALALVDRALKLCPEISVIGIAGPGETLDTPYAIETFRLVHTAHPNLIHCLSTNGLLLERYADELWEAGVKTITVTLNAVKPDILQNICSHIILDGKRYIGLEAANILIEAQKRGIKKIAALGAIVKINIVLIPELNGNHIAEIAETAKSLGASLINIIPLIPQHDLSHLNAPNCNEINKSRTDAEGYLPVFRHCQHCRADACGIPGVKELSPLLYGHEEMEQTFSHG
ncbi:MAG: radical SAM protein [Mobilitalea sp.]